MPRDDDKPPAAKLPRADPHFTEAARVASRAAQAAKREQAERFGEPELFVTVIGGKAFTWELRRFGGIVLERSTETFGDVASAREAGEAALAALRAMPGLPTFKRAIRP